MWVFHERFNLEQLWEIEQLVCVLQVPHLQAESPVNTKLISRSLKRVLFKTLERRFNRLESRLVPVHHVLCLYSSIDGQGDEDQDGQERSEVRPMSVIAIDIEANRLP